MSGLRRGLSQPVILVLHTLLRQARGLPRLHAHHYLHNFSRPAEHPPNPWVGTEPLTLKVHGEVKGATAGTHRGLVRSQWDQQSEGTDQEEGGRGHAKGGFLVTGRSDIE